MSSISRHDRHRLRVGGIMLAICLSLPVADHFGKSAGAGLAALLASPSASVEQGEIAELAYNARQDLPSKP